MFNRLLEKCGGLLKSRRKLIIIALPLVFVCGVAAWWASLCPVDVESVPIQIVYAFEYGEVTTLSNTKFNRSSFSSFPAFATAVTEHLAAKLAQERICLNSTESREGSLLQFVTSGVNVIPQTSVPPLEGRPSNGCRLTSPWVDLVIERKPVPSVRGIVRYSERQLLVDQALLAGLQVPPGTTAPLNSIEFRRYADLEYAPSEILHEPMEKPVEERVPPDLLWLFRHSSQESEVSFTGLAIGSMRAAMSTGSEGYTKIVIKLIDRCLESEGEDIHYNNILDVDDAALLEQYRIVTSISRPFKRDKE
ncbi:hypothetical protein LJB99_04345 [Deltaproteobacteria bacterium OttesenSCG-928-K17]|nr:hypothetical protein [Deltaproteobacteria bacterium OttesenSCG-928-K17]